MCTRDNDDGTSHGYGSKPPAEGFDFIEGPKVPAGPADSALVDGPMVQRVCELPDDIVFVYSNGSFFQLLDPPTGIHIILLMHTIISEGSRISP